MARNQYVDGISFPVESTTVLTKGHFAKINSSGNAVHCGANDESCLGVLDIGSPSGSTDRVRVNMLSRSARVVVKAGTALTVGATVTSDADGKAVATSSGQRIFGVVATAAAAEDADFEMLVVGSGTAA